MSVPISTQKGDYEEVLKLINGVFGKSLTFPVTMEKIFPDLLGEKNMDRMRIIKEDGHPVSAFNYLTNELSICGNIIKSASVGSVCTHVDYRGKGYSTLLLNDCLRRMKEEGVDFLFVSGDRNLYIRNNIHKAGTLYEFVISPEKAAELDKDGGIEVKECTEKDNSELYALYNLEDVRFLRTESGFAGLVRNAARAGVTRTNYVQRVYGIYAGGKMTSYIVLGERQDEESGNVAFIVEYAGERKAVLQGLGRIAADLKLEKLSGYAVVFDKDMVGGLRSHRIVLSSGFYPGTVRIINFEQMMKKLTPLFVERLNTGNLVFSEQNGAYTVQLDTKKLIIKDDKVMHHIFLGSSVPAAELKAAIEGDTGLFEQLKNNLEIPIPFPYNLNYA